MERYYIKHKTDEMYVHFNPYTVNYYIDDKLLGAVGFYYDNGMAFMKSSGIDEDFDLVMMSPVNVKKTSRSNEPFLYDKTH